MGIDILGTSSSSSPSAVSEMFSDVKNIIGMGTGGLDEVMGDGNTRYLQDFTNGGVSEMIR